MLRYAVNVDDGGWQRAKILEIEEDSATVFLGDHGDDDTVQIHKIKILEPQFRKLPAQVFILIVLFIHFNRNRHIIYLCKKLSILLYLYTMVKIKNM